MKDEVSKLLDKVRKSDGSAFTIVEFVLDDIIRLANTGRMSRERWKELALGLKEAKRSMAPLYNISNMILLNLEKENFERELAQELDSIHKDHTDSVRTISDKFVRDHRPRRVMVNSYSATVMECLLRLAQEVDLEVTVAESLPMGEGVMFAESLASRKVKAEIISDSMVFEWMKKVDIFLSGADAIVPGKIYNKVGSKSIVHAAHSEGKVVIVVCDTLKIAPMEIYDLSGKVTVMGQRLKRHTCLFECFESSLVDMVITEKWSRSGADLQDIFKSWRTSPLLEKV